MGTKCSGSPGMLFTWVMFVLGLKGEGFPGRDELSEALAEEGPLVSKWGGGDVHLGWRPQDSSGEAERGGI